MTILLIFVSMISSWVIGNKLVSSLLESTCRGTRLIRLAMAIGNGLAATSIILFIWLLASHGNTTYYPIAEAVFAAALFGIAFLKKRHNAEKKANIEVSDLPLTEETIVGRKISKVFWALFIMAATSVTLFSFSLPHGKWDAWAIWNLRARFIYRAGASWTAAFSEHISFSHTDYPLLLPLSVTKGWLYAGFETLASPMTIGIVFSAAVLLLLFGAVMAMRGPVAAIFAATALTSTPFFLEMSASQYADVPLSFFLLASLIMISLYTRAPKPGTLALAGLNAGFAAWTKNEGLLFAAVVTIFVTIMAFRRKETQPPVATLANYFAGLILALLPVICFKLLLAPTNDLVREFVSSHSNPLFDFERYKVIAAYMFATTLSFGNWQGFLFGAFNPLAIMTAYLFQVGIEFRSYENWLLPGVILVMLGGYFFAYLNSPHELRWHLSTSCDRLFLQLWPATIFSFFMLTEEVKDRSSTEKRQDVSSA
ncbi:MAG: hypothetical protein ACD_39C00875G0001 [uncultured bacterium]|nr:MAG: hypothetical protein ACD_39C00875G0001 [uncultured bacterium]